MALAVEAEQLVKRFSGRSGTVEAVRGVRHWAGMILTWTGARSRSS